MTQIIETHRDSFLITNDPARQDIDAICDMLSRSYWANTRPREKTKQAVANSLTFGVFENGKQIGVARVVTDCSIVAYLCDVYIHEAYRARGLGKWLVETLLTHPDVKDVRRWILFTDDARTLYARHGFGDLPEPEKWMQRLRPFEGE